MASFHFAVKSISRGKGHSSTAAAAYRLGVNITCERTGVVHNYTKKTGVLHGEMKAPQGAPEWTNDPSEFWNRVEMRDTRANARVAREFVVSLPHELSLSANIQLARDIAQLVVDRYQTVAQIAIHAPDKGGDDRNVHLHLMFAPRVVTAAGFGDYTARVYDDFKQGPQEILAMREHIAMLTNVALHSENIEARVDHRRLEDQAMDAVDRGDLKSARDLDRLPTVKEGKKPLRARAQRSRNNRIRRSNEARQTKWDLMEGKARAECRLMPAYTEEKHHDRAHETNERPSAGGSHQRGARRVNPPITSAEIHDYKKRRESPDFESVLVMPKGRGAVPIQPRWEAERTPSVLSGDEPRRASERVGVQSPRKIPWRSKGVPKPITAAHLAPSIARAATASTKSTAGADSYGRERIRQDEESLELEIAAMNEVRKRTRDIAKSTSVYARADEQFIQQMTRGTSVHQRAWTDHHNRAKSYEAWLAEHANEAEKRHKRMAVTEEKLSMARFGASQWKDRNPKPQSMAEQAQWQEEWNTKVTEINVLEASVERLRFLTQEKQISALQVKRQHALDSMHAALQQRRLIAPLPSEQKVDWKSFRFPARQTGPPGEKSAAKPLPYPRFGPPKK